MNVETFCELIMALLLEWPKAEQEDVVMDQSASSLRITDQSKPYTIQITVDKAAKTIKLSGGATDAK